MSVAQKEKNMYILLWLFLVLCNTPGKDGIFFLKDIPQLILSLLKALMLFSKSVDIIFSQSSDRNFFLDARASKHLGATGCR